MKNGLVVFLRHAASAASMLAIVLTLAEIVSPGSVLSVFPLFGLWFLACALLACAPVFYGPRRGRLMVLVPLVFPLAALCFLLVHDEGSGRWSLLGSGVMVLGVLLAGLAIKEED